MKDAAWQPGGGNIPATKAVFRDIALHKASDATSNMEVGEIALLGDDDFHAKNSALTFVLADAADLSALKTRVDVETDANGKGTKRILVAQTSDPETGAGEGVFYAKSVSGVVELFYRYPSNGAVLQLTTGGVLNVGSDTGAKLMTELASAPATAADQGAFYTKDVSGVTEAFYRYASSGAEVQLTSGGAINAATKAQIVPLVNVAADADYPAYDVELGSAGYKQWVVALVDGSDSGINFEAILPDATKNYQLVLKLKQSTALAGRTVAIKFQALAIQDGEDPVAASYDVDAVQALSCRSDTNLLTVENAAFRIPTSALHTDNQLVRGRILRDGDGTGATDDHTGICYMVDAFFKAVS